MQASEDVFADTAFWIALILKRDRYNLRAQECFARLRGKIVTTVPVLIETANALSRPSTRRMAIDLVGSIQSAPTCEVIPLSDSVWKPGCQLYRDRPDKGWSLADCISFVVMQEMGLSLALTSDEHFRQAGFRALLLETD